MSAGLPSSRLKDERIVWVFNPVDSPSRFPAGIWTSRAAAEEWIRSVDARGVLSAYTLDESAWDANVRLGLLKLSEPERSEAAFKRKFTTAVDHYHYNGPDMHSVTLGRDVDVRPSQETSDGKRYQCVCCGQFTLESVDSCAICTECGWEDWYECLDNPSRKILPNRVSLDVARSLVQRFGPGAACEVGWATNPLKRIAEIEAMPQSEYSKLQTARQRVEQDR